MLTAPAARSNITHRDLKLENLLLQRPAAPDEAPAVVIADFVLAKKMAEQAMRTICGTPQYVAPEVILVRATSLGRPGGSSCVSSNMNMLASPSPHGGLAAHLPDRHVHRMHLRTRSKHSAVLSWSPLLGHLAACAANLVAMAMTLSA